jgi:hypothetical protein
MKKAKLAAGDDIRPEYRRSDFGQLVRGKSVGRELLPLLEDLEDGAEIRRLREAGENEEVLPWEQAKEKLRRQGVDV